MKPGTFGSLLLLTAVIGGCKETIVEPPPPAASMTFKQGARYQYSSYHTDPQDSTRKSDSSSRTWSLLNTSASAHGRSGVVVYIDSVVALGGVGALVVDTVYLQQSSGDLYRYASLAPELDFAGATVIDPDLGRDWMRESRPGTTAGGWLVGEASDTIQYNLGIPGVDRLKVTVKDTVTASALENISIDNKSYEATKTTHRLELSFSILVTVTLPPPIGTSVIPVKIASESLGRTTWTVPSLGAIVREDRQGRVINATYEGQSYTIPVPGYFTIMTKVLATGG